MIYQLTATPQSMKPQLWDIGIDYTAITPYELFYYLLYKIYPVGKTSVIFGSLDLTKFQQCVSSGDSSLILLQTINDEQVIIDETIYMEMMRYLRQVHDIQADERIPANETTKMILIEDDRDELLRNNGKKYHSYLKNMVSAMVNNENFKYSHRQVWDMKINAFMDSVKRISKLKNADLLLQSGYSGFGIDLKAVDKKQLDWLGELG